MGDRLSLEFYKQSALQLAPMLLGKYLCKKQPNGAILKRIITETECYMGEDDTACHASRGKTPRNAPMYEAGGITYIYLCYGMHYLLNVVAGERDFPEAVLLRGIEGASGPARLTKALGIDISLNKVDLCTSNEIWLEEGECVPYICTPRVGIGYASEADQQKLWRFVSNTTSH